MVQGLSVSRLVNVSINLQPQAAPRRNFGTVLIAGDSNVIDGFERIRAYTDLDGVAQDFGINAPEYKAALLYYAQVPQPQNLLIGRWLRTATAGLLRGGILSAAEQLIASWQAVTNGTFNIVVDSVVKNLTTLNFSGAANLNAVAAIIDTALTGASVVWDGSRFVITSDTTGSASSVAYATPAGSGTDVSTKMKITLALASLPVSGYAAETPAECAATLYDQSADWYGLSFAASTMPTTLQLVDVASFIEGVSVKRVFGCTETDVRALDIGYQADIASVMASHEFKRTVVQYSSSSPYAVDSLFGRAFTVNFNANNSTITLMYKQEPVIVAEVLTESQAQALKAKRCNVFVAYQNDTAIIQYGVMSGPAYFDEIHGLDWFQDALQNALYNLLYQSATKIPQTDAGMNQLVNVAAGVCDEAVNNGLVAGGIWNADGFGQLKRGQPLTSGFYIYTQPMALQSQAEREQRIAPPMQIALKLAGAIQELNVIVNVNR